MIIHRVEMAPMSARIDVTPVIGVLLALLTVVVATMPVISTAWRVEHPPMDMSTSERPYREPVAVTVGVSGALIVNRGPNAGTSSPDTLAGDVCAALGGGDCRRYPVFVRGQPDTNYADFLAAMQTLKSEGFRVDFLNEDVE
jgi:biopolymer transport protein ExbD